MDLFSLATDPSTDSAVLEDLANSFPDVCPYVAANPNTSREVLDRLAGTYPMQVLHNPVLPLLLLENPQGFSVPAGVALALTPGCPDSLIAQYLRLPADFTRTVVADTVVYLPPMCEVPAGPFLMGSSEHNPRREDDEKPQHTVTLDTFSVSKYPLTVAEYACFIRATQRAVPGGWEEQLAHTGDPVWLVRFDEAVEYARWIARLTGRTWRLPTEAEWEKAARGIDGRNYPWGDQEDVWNRANVGSEFRILPRKWIVPVGTYPEGASPYGALDMAGNVWEWTCSIYDQQRFPYPYHPGDGREVKDGQEILIRQIGLDHDIELVIRGGSYDSSPSSARVASRYPQHPDDATQDDLGARLVIASAIQSDDD